MSFKNKMKNRGFSKLDKLVETPDYITPVQKKNTNLNWLKIAIPVTAGLALIIIPISVVSKVGFKGNRNSQKHSDSSPTSSDPDYGYEGGSAPAPSDSVSDKDTKFDKLLEKYHIYSNITIEVYDYADGYLSPTYVFTNEESASIINSLKSLTSDFDSYDGKLTTAKRNTSGYIIGINHRLIFKDGSHKMTTNYFSQFATLVIESSAFDLSGSQAFTLMDSHIEMDYDSSYDETIN